MVSCFCVFFQATDAADVTYEEVDINDNNVVYWWWWIFIYWAHAWIYIFANLQEYILNSRGLKLFTCKWLPNDEPKALVFLCHGYAMDCSISMRGEYT